MSSIRLLAVCAFFFLHGCGYSQEEFGKRCRALAGIEVRDRELWQGYLRERKQALDRLKVTVNGKEVDPTDIDPLVFTDSFEWTSDWVARGMPSVPKNKPYRNDRYVVQKNTGTVVARFRNLSLSVPSFETTLGYDCTTSHPHLYTGGHQHTGTIQVLSH